MEIWILRYDITLLQSLSQAEHILLGQAVQALVNNPSIQPQSKLRLTMLYALRYQKSAANNIASLISSLVEVGVTKEEAQVRRVFRTTLLI